MFLLDVNVLVALGWDNHAHHECAHAWFDAHRSQGWATSPVTQCGLLRLSTNPKVVSVALRPGAAIAVLRQIVSLPGHTFWPDLLEPVEAVDVGLRGYKQITDAYLVAVARHQGGRLATFDAATATLPAGLGLAVEVIR